MKLKKNTELDFRYLSGTVKRKKNVLATKPYISTVICVILRQNMHVLCKLQKHFSG